MVVAKPPDRIRWVVDRPHVVEEARPPVEERESRMMRTTYWSGWKVLRKLVYLAKIPAEPSMQFTSCELDIPEHRDSPHNLHDPPRPPCHNLRWHRSPSFEGSQYCRRVVGPPGRRAAADGLLVLWEGDRLKLGDMRAELGSDKTRERLQRLEEHSLDVRSRLAGKAEQAVRFLDDDHLLVFQRCSQRPRCVRLP
jgi:hypothetical protein